MAARVPKPKLESITTAEILRKLKQVTEKGGDNREFFYLYVSTSGKEKKKKQQRAQAIPQGQQRITFPPQIEEDSEDDEITDDDSDQDDQDAGRDDHDDIMDSQDNSQADQSEANTSFSSQPSLPSPFSQPLSKDNPRTKTMDHVHKVTLPKVLGPEEWKKVFDKDTKLTYRALYFNVIRQHPDEEEFTFIQRVGQI